MLNMVKYTIDGDKHYARLTSEELETLRQFAASNTELKITSVEEYRGRKIR